MAENIMVEHVSGSRAARPGVDALMAKIGAVDTLIVWKVDRLGISLSDLVKIITTMGERGAQFRSLTEAGMDATTAQGRLLFGIMGSLAEFGRELIVERTKAGPEAARRSGRKPGRLTVVSPGKLKPC